MSQTLAVITTGGKQYVVTPGSTIRVEKFDGEEGSTITFPEVLLVSTDANVTVGTPTVSGAKVTGKIVKHGRADKVVGVKFKAKKRQHMRFGHRQHYTEIQIESIG